MPNSKESQPQNPEFRINPENFHPCSMHILNSFSASGGFFCYLLTTFTRKLRQNVGPDLDPKLFDTIMVFLKEYLKKGDFEKRSADNKTHEKNYSACKDLTQLAVRKTSDGADQPAHLPL